MKLFKIEDFRDVRNIVNKVYSSVPELIEDTLTNHMSFSFDKVNEEYFKRHEHQILYCLIEQFKRLDMEDTSYLMAIVELDQESGKTVKIIGKYHQDYIHNLLCYCDRGNFVKVFGSFYPKIVVN